MITVICDNPDDLDNANKIIDCVRFLGVKVNLENSCDDAFWRGRVRNYIENKHQELDKESKDFVVNVATKMMKYSDIAVNEENVGNICELAFNGFSSK